MPVSATEKRTSVFATGRLRRDANLASLSELQGVGYEVSENLRHLAFVGIEAGKVQPRPRRSSSTDWFSSRGRSIPRNAANRLAASNSTGLASTFPASTLARSSRSFTSSSRSCAARLTITHLLALFPVQVAIGAIQQQVRSTPESSSEAIGIRGSCWRGIAISIRPRGGGDPPFHPARHTGRHAPVGIFQFPIQPRQFRLTRSDLLQRPQQLLVLDAAIPERRPAGAPGSKRRRSLQGPGCPN